MEVSRRTFVRNLAAASAAAWSAPTSAAGQALRGPRLDDRIAEFALEQRLRSRLLNDRFPDLARHFIFEYYAWYSPTGHWTQWDREPPTDLASNYMPRLGAYDSSDVKVMEQHARWIAGAGVGAINVSWWGPGDFTDRLIPTLMDVMRAHDIHVTFHLEPYSTRRGLDYARDIQYLIREYGDRRRWDCFLLLQHEDGTTGPVFKTFLTNIPPTSTDCRGVRSDVADYTPDETWRRQTDRVRELFAGDFDRITLLSDSLDVDRVRASGFDGIAIYNNFVEPDTWATHARNASARNLVFSFNVNPGFDAIAERHPAPGPCPYVPPTFEPGRVRYDWTRPGAREQAALLSAARIKECFQTTMRLQNNPTLANVKRGFFLTYINSFNEWHEGHQFEPMKDASALTPEERKIGYHNPEKGAYRLALLGELLADLDL